MEDQIVRSKRDIKFSGVCGGVGGRGVKWCIDVFAGHWSRGHVVTWSCAVVTGHVVTGHVVTGHVVTDVRWY